jgi:hypothetical protein
MDADELRALADAALDGRLTPEQAARLEHLVLTDPAACRFYTEYAHQHAALQWAAANPAPPQPTPAPVAAPRRRWFWRRDLAWGALTAALLVAVWVAAGRRDPQPAQPQHPPQLVARLVETKACRWDSGTLPTVAGSDLGPGRLRLAEGLARVTFASGAEVTLEGPADIELVSPMACVLHGGQLVAKVPPAAVGFVVDTPSSRVTDFGTEFGVTVRDGTTADVQVFDGRVDVHHRPTGRTEPMLTGNSLRFAPGAITPFNANAHGPREGATPPAAAGTRVVQVSTATGRGRDAFVMPLAEIPPDRQSTTLLLVKNTVPKMEQWNRKVYMGLDLAGVARPRVRDAELRLTFAPTEMGFAAQVPDATFAVYGLTDETLDDWDERAIRWPTAPANRPGGAALDPAKVVRLGSFVLAQGEQAGTRTVGGPALVEFLRRDTNHLATFILVRETRGSGATDLVHGVVSRRHPSLPPPTLRLTVADAR